MTLTQNLEVELSISEISHYRTRIVESMKRSRKITIYFGKTDHRRANHSVRRKIQHLISRYPLMAGQKKTKTISRFNCALVRLKQVVINFGRYTTGALILPCKLYRTGELSLEVKLKEHWIVYAFTILE